jgi:hypothetical protein
MVVELDFLVGIAFVTASGLRAGMERNRIFTQTSFAEGYPDSAALPEKGD